MMAVWVSVELRFCWDSFLQSLKFLIMDLHFKYSNKDSKIDRKISPALSGPVLELFLQGPLLLELQVRLQAPQPRPAPAGTAAL